MIVRICVGSDWRTLVNDLINQPRMRRGFIYGLRDTCYSFNTAAADGHLTIPIAANATEVNVRLELAEDGRKFVSVCGDNGDGNGQPNVV